MEGDNKSNNREKVNSAIILVVCVFALFFGYYQLANNINNPFSFLGKTSASDLAQIDPDSALKSQDTDGDGLSDYDESNIYGTSPYLADSDGDGINDGQEIKQGTDPNCPEGKTCFGAGLNTATSSDGSVPTFQSSPPSQTNPSIDIAAVRKSLVASGLSQAEVDAMTDQDIYDTYQQVLNENPDLAGQIQGNNVSSPVPSTVLSSSGTVATFTKPKTVDTTGLNVSSLDDLKSLTGAQIKELMIKNGAPKTLLDSVSDDELRQMFLDKINSTASTTP